VHTPFAVDWLLVVFVVLSCLQTARWSTAWSKCIAYRKQYNVVECYNIWVSAFYGVIYHCRQLCWRKLCFVCPFVGLSVCVGLQFTKIIWKFDHLTVHFLPNFAQ